MKKNSKYTALKIYKTVKKHFASFIIVAAMLATFATATSDSYITSEDPLVSLSYLNKVKDEILDSISAIVKEEIEKQSVGGGSSSAIEEYENLTLSIGQKVIAKSSCDIILLSGSARAICPSLSQALIDKTDDISIQNNIELTKNHLIQIPRADGRGIVSTWEGTCILIRGEYEIN